MGGGTGLDQLRLYALQKSLAVNLKCTCRRVLPAQKRCGWLDGPVLGVG